MKLLSLYFSRLVWGSGLLVLALFCVALQANATASTLLPQSGGFDVDAFDTVIITGLQQKRSSVNEVETTISYTVASQLAVRIDTYQEGDYYFGVRLPGDAQNVQVAVDDTDIECSAEGNCHAYYECIVVILLPQCFAINSTAHVSYQRTTTIKAPVVDSATLRGDLPDALSPFTFAYSASKYGGSGLYAARIDWRSTNQPGQLPLRYRDGQPARYTFIQYDPNSLNIAAGVTDLLSAALTLSRQKPLLLIPGIAGSKLVGGGEELWPGILLSPAKRQLLSLDPRQQALPLITAPDVIAKVGWSEIYQPLLEFLQKTGGYALYAVNEQPARRTAQGCDVEAQKQNYPTLFVFAYDWRKSNIENAAFVADYVKCIQKFYPESKIDILAHSMGGLLTRRYLLDYPTAPVNRVITVASPWLGTPKAILTLETGAFLNLGQNIGLRLSDLDIKNLTRFFPGFHELLPSQFYFGKGATPFIEDGWDIDGDGNAFEAYTYSALKELLNKRFPPVVSVQAPVLQNEQLHTAAQDFQTEASTVNYFHLYGATNKKATVAQVQAKLFTLCNELYICEAIPLFDVLLAQGDNTVTVASASRGDEADAKGNIVYKKVTGDEMDHTTMLHTRAVQAYIQAILEDRQPVTVDQRTAHAATLENTPLTSLRLVNSSAPTIIDDQGNGFTVDAGSFGDAMLDVTHYRLGERTHALLLPTDGSYTITMQIGPTPAALIVSADDDTSPTQVVRYLDLSFPTTRTVTLRLPYTLTSLQQDSNGDGVTDSVIAPDSVATDALASDLQPPQVTFTAIAQSVLQQVTLTAQDEVAGVARLFYSTDGRQFQAYTAPLVVNPAQVARLFAFAEDHAANRSSLYQFALEPNVPQPASPRLYLPLVARAGLPTPGPATPTPLPFTATPTPASNATPTPSLTPTAPIPVVIDPTFGNGGRVVTALGHSYGVELVSVTAYQTDGKLISGNGHTLLRVTAAGELDPTFGDSGFVTVLPTIYDLVLQTDGKLLVGGALYPDGLETIADFTVVRYLPNGQLDPTFATGGLLRIASRLTKFARATQLALQPDGKILVLGRLPYTEGDIAATPVVVRLLPSGAIDTTFGEAGKRFLQETTLPYLAIYTMALQPDGKILLGGDSGSETTGAILWRLKANGTLDPTFDGDGKYMTDFGAGLRSVEHIALQPDGKLVMTVASPYRSAGEQNMDIVRLLADGTLDVTFANAGRATVNLSAVVSETATDLVVLPDSKLLVRGILDGGNEQLLLRLSSAGALDQSFGQNGLLALSTPDLRRTMLARLLLQPDGQVVLSGVRNLWASGLRWLTLIRVTAAGAFDPTFDNDGELLVSPGNSVATTVALQADGKVLVGGYTSYNRRGAPEAWSLLRYTTSGALDPTFADAGKLITTFQENSGAAWIRALAVQPDGKIIALGQLYFPNSGWSEQSYDTGLLRYNPDGTLDTTFATQGQWQTRLPLALDKTTHPLALQPDGKIVMVGNQTVDGQTHFVLVRLNSDGSFDPTFDGDGQQRTPLDSSAEARALALQPDGKLVVVGRARTSQTFEDAFVLVRYQANGALDPTFDGDGQLFTPFQQTEGAYAIAVQADGKLVAAGVARGEDGNSNADFTLVRYQANGALDGTFAGDGQVFTHVAAASTSGIRALLLQPDGKIVVAGYTADEYNRNFALARYLPTGAIDTTFACGGLVQTDFGATNDMVTALARQPDGKLIAVGYTYYTMALARYLPEAGCK